MNIIDLSLPQSPVLKSCSSRKHLIFEILPLSELDKTNWAYGKNARAYKSSPAAAAEPAGAHMAMRLAVCTAGFYSAVIAAAR
jgi:hypothetical protein